VVLGLETHIETWQIEVACCRGIVGVPVGANKIPVVQVRLWEPFGASQTALGIYSFLCKKLSSGELQGLTWEAYPIMFSKTEVLCGVGGLAEVHVARANAFGDDHGISGGFFGTSDACISTQTHLANCSY